MKANSGLKKNRTKIQMVLSALVILSIVRQFFLKNYHNIFLKILILLQKLFWIHGMQFHILELNFSHHMQPSYIFRLPH